MNFDFLTAYMENDDGDHDKLTAGLEISGKFLRDTAINLLAAGKDTVSAALSWFFWLIAKHPLVENKIWKRSSKSKPIIIIFGRSKMTRYGGFSVQKKYVTWFIYMEPVADIECV